MSLLAQFTLDNEIAQSMHMHRAVQFIHLVDFAVYLYICRGGIRQNKLKFKLYRLIALLRV